MTQKITLPRSKCANCGKAIELRKAPDSDAWVAWNAAASLGRTRHRCGFGAITHRTFDDLSPEERKRFRIPDDWVPEDPVKYARLRKNEAARKETARKKAAKEAAARAA